MSAKPNPVRIFIGSSVEGQDVALNLQDELERRVGCEVDLWQHVFEPSGYALDSLLAVAAKVDFAVLVASPDDVTASRDMATPSVRDNIVLEFGIFAGALGRERTYLLATGDRTLKLPTDLMGLTRLPYRPRVDGNQRASVNGAVLEVERQVKRFGHLVRGAALLPAEGPAAPVPDNTPKPGSADNLALEAELAVLRKNAEAQGWRVRTNTPTTLRLRSPKEQEFVLSKTTPRATREELRLFAKRINSVGLRVNKALLDPVDASPF